MSRGSLIVALCYLGAFLTWSAAGLLALVLEKAGEQAAGSVVVLALVAVLAFGVVVSDAADR